MKPLLPRILRKLRLLGRRFRFEVARPRLSAADVAARIHPDAGVDVRAPGGFARLVEHHLRATVPAPVAAAGAAVDDDAGDAHALERVDWHREDHFGVDWPRRYVGAMSDFLAGSDLVLLWHKNKMTPLLDLARRFRATGERRYADRWYAVVDGWCRQNPPMVGMNWRSPMEVGTRLVVWSRCLSLLADAPPPGDAVCRRIVESVLRQADFLAGHFSAKDVPNNHLIGEAATLYAFAAHWPELASSSPWMEKARAILENEARRQVLADGVQYEVAVNYHLYVLDFFLVYFHACAGRGAEPAPAVLDAAERMIDATLALVSPRGRFPRIGDDSLDEFLALAPTWTAGMDTAGGFRARALVRAHTAAALEATPWGRALLERSGPPATLARHFADAGIVVMRTAHSHLVFTGTPQHDRPFSPGHVHADGGGFELEVDGEPLVVDSGTYLYNYDDALRDHLRRARAHSSVLVDDIDPARTERTFDWRVRPAGRVIRVGGSGGDVGFVAWEQALPGDDGAAFLHRRVLVQLSRVWLVVDRVAPVASPDAAAHADGAHTARALLHTPLPRERVAAVGSRKASLSLPGGGGEWIVEVHSTLGHALELIDGAVDPRGLFSPVYGERRAGTTLGTSVAVGGGCSLLHLIRDGGTGVRGVDWRADGVEIELTGGAGARRVRVDLAAPGVGVDGTPL